MVLYLELLGDAKKRDDEVGFSGDGRTGSGYEYGE